MGVEVVRVGEIGSFASQIVYISNERQFSAGLAGLGWRPTYFDRTYDPRI